MGDPQKNVDGASLGFPIKIRDELLFSVPLYLTCTRVVLTSVLITTLMEGGQGFPVFALACLTDALDGALARRLHAESKLGGLLDASADFFLIFSTSMFLVWNGLASFWFLCLMAISFIKFVFFKEASRPDPLGKHIGTVLFVALGVVLVYPVVFVAYWAISVASCYVVASMMLCFVMPRRIQKDQCANVC